MLTKEAYVYYSRLLFGSDDADHPGLIRFDDNDELVHIEQIAGPPNSVFLDGDDVVALVRVALPLLSLEQCTALFDLITMDDDKVKQLFSQLQAKEAQS